MKKVFLALIALLSLAGCADDKNNKEETLETEDQLKFSIVNLEKSFENCDPETGECTFISLNFPQAKSDSEASEKINKRINDFLIAVVDYEDSAKSEDPEDLVQKFIQNYKETAADFPDYNLPWEATIEGQVIHQENEIICIRFNTYMFTGGAHGYQSVNYMIFDESGKELEEKELFSNDFIAMVEKDFRKRQDIPEGENINSTGMFFKDDQFHLPANIGITDKKLILQYNAYEIAPYASGSFTMEYPREKIDSFLKINKPPKA